jgi:peptidoglycan/LPS O-acetylase OafA/YrhL
LGLATYPLYLLHHYVGESMLLAATALGIAGTVAVWPVMAAMIGLALFVALSIEPPIRRLIGPMLGGTVRKLGPAAA